ncbi:MAG: hypothetical protein IKD08_05625 [Alphaproteobacteria bacterium]|nr:hypothetical protein [Alphaproteobacteria bacterium]
MTLNNSKKIELGVLLFTVVLTFGLLGMVIPQIFPPLINEGGLIKIYLDKTL